MSLDDAQRARTLAEFDANLDASGLSRDELRARTGLSADRFDAAYAVSARSADPVDVWLVRDALESAVREAGAPLTPFTVLTDESRRAARGWFGVRDRRTGA